MRPDKQRLAGVRIYNCLTFSLTGLPFRESGEHGGGGPNYPAPDAGLKTAPAEDRPPKRCVDYVVGGL